MALYVNSLFVTFFFSSPPLAHPVRLGGGRYGEKKRVKESGRWVVNFR
jgi:hypothetical protein